MRFLLASLLCCLPLAAHADTYQQFDLNATFANGGTITGTVDLDLDTTPSYGLFNQYADLVYTLNGTPTDIVETNPSIGGIGLATQMNFFFGPAGTEFLLDLPTTTPFDFADFSGGLCTGQCPGDYHNSAIVYALDPHGDFGFIYATSGTFVADGAPFVSDTPEPASLMLLGTAAALIGWRRSIA